jgi:membrane-associated phospholipid phosphatase
MAEFIYDNDTAQLKSTPRSALRRRLAARRLWRAEVIYVAGLTAFAVLALFAHFFTYFAWDLAVTRALQTLPVPGLHGFMRYISQFGNAPRLITVTAVALLACNMRSEAFWLTWSGGGSWLINKLLKYVVARPRPTSDLITVFHRWEDNSFPSGHVMFYVCFFGFLFFVAYEHLPRGSLARRLALTVTALPVALIGLSRVYLGEHWPSDILGSYLVGGVWLALSLRFYRRWKYAQTDVS